MFSVESIPSLQGKVVIITGGTAGLGLASAIQLCKKGAHVIITARSKDKGEKAIQDIRTASSGEGAGHAEYGIADNENLHSIKEFASWFLAKNLPLHVLMLNAGIACVAFKLVEGVESQLFVNHVAHHLLVQLLLPKIKESAPSRVVIVSSDAHQLAKRFPFPTPDEHSYGIMKNYGESKLANIYFGRELQRRLGDGSRVFVNMAHPGVVSTNIGSKSDFPWYARPFVGLAYLLLGETSDQGALTQLYLAASPEVEAKGLRGQYFVPVAQHRERLGAVPEDQAAAAALWDWTEQTITRVLAAPPRPA
mmetsp:Transcript_74404/g.198836  ORF Transcript_74404/g.198836 Transcript_74404/m.198836 type:complete len:307 (-) Transcript_74404:332-1252(-)